MPTVETALADVLDYLTTPVSQLDVDHCVEFIENQKAKLKDSDADLRDGKRRVSAAKGPRRPKKSDDIPDAGSDSDEPEEVIEEE